MTNEIDIDASINCHYWNYQGKSENEGLVHSVNSHPGIPARPDDNLLKLIKYYDNAEPSINNNYDNDRKSDGL